MACLIFFPIYLLVLGIGGWVFESLCRICVKNKTIGRKVDKMLDQLPMNWMY